MGSQSLGIAWRNEESCFAIFDRVCDAPYSRSDDRPTTCHCFERSQSKWFVPWGRHGYIACTIVVTQFLRLSLADETNIICDTQFCRQFLQLTNLRSRNRI